MNLTNIKKVFISGIGGIGVSAVARYFNCHGVEVVGSDLEKSEITEALEKLGIKIYYEQKAENVTYACDLLVYSSAVPNDNPERIKAKEQNIEQKSYFEVLGELSRQNKTVAVSGTHGKSTTTAMLAGVLIDSDQDPSVILGSCFEKLDNNFRCGERNLLIMEACEYRAHMLLLKPQTIILNNIEEDHLDFYKDINHIKQTFQQYISGLRNEDDLLIYNNDDVNIRDLKLPKCKMIRYGLIGGADVWADNIRKLPGKQVFNVVYYSQDIGDFELNVPGDHNIYNALAAIAYALSLDVPIGKIKQSIKEFKGIWRRFEVIKNESYTVISDYAHHPTAIQETIKGVREFLPSRRVVVVFQPHQRDRTKKLFDDFVKSFDLADVVILPEIYDVAGREEGQNVSSKGLVEKIKQNNPKKQIEYAEDLMEARVKVKSIIQDEDVVLVMGAGDVYKIASEI